MTTEQARVRTIVRDVVDKIRIVDIHTHLFSLRFGPLLLRGIDELLTYHYLVAEALRYLNLSADSFWRLGKREQADLVWRTLFIEHLPASEACRGVLTVLERLGLDLASRNLADYRSFFECRNLEDHVARVFELAGLDFAVMTNDPFDEEERPVWFSGKEKDARFRAALRLDPLLNTWDTAAPRLRSWGFAVSDDLAGRTMAEVRRFLLEWIERIDALYLAVSLPPSFAFPEKSVRARLIEECVLSAAAEKNMPVALMIGVRRGVNPDLRLAGDGVGKADVGAVENLCRAFPDHRFLATFLSRENQHELCVAARKFRNLMPFGCWWFLNTPGLIAEMTAMRLDLLGGSFIPQHSDARVLEHLIYKWVHGRKVIGDVLAEKYSALAAIGWTVSEAEIRRDLAELFGGNFLAFCQGLKSNRGPNFFHVPG